MKITELREENVVILQIQGYIDTTTSPQLQQAILLSFQKMKNVVLDFKDVEYISSAGLRALLLGHKTAISKGGTMQMHNVSKMVMDVLEMVGFHDILNIE